jgi:hypothetical protein
MIWLKTRNLTTGTTLRYVNLNQIISLGAAQLVTGGPFHLSFSIADMEANPGTAFTVYSYDSYPSADEAYAAFEALVGTANVKTI